MKEIIAQPLTPEAFQPYGQVLAAVGDGPQRHDFAGRVESNRPHAKELSSEPPPKSPTELRKQFPKGISDEEFLLRAVMPADQVDAMVAAGPAKRHYNPDVGPILKLLTGLQNRASIPDMVIEKPDFRLELHGNKRDQSHG